MNNDELEAYFINYFDNEILQTAYQNILNIKNMCEDYSLKKELKIPSLIWKSANSYSNEEYNKYFELMPYLKNFFTSDFDGDRHMVNLIIDKLKSDERLQNKETYEELNDNLRITWESSEVNKAHWSAYFLNLQKTNL